jgi:hypothetical protein
MGCVPAPISTGPVLGFLVDDVETARKRLEAEGIEFIGPVQTWEPTGEVRWCFS